MDVCCAVLLALCITLISIFLEYQQSESRSVPVRPRLGPGPSARPLSPQARAPPSYAPGLFPAVPALRCLRLKRPDTPVARAAPLRAALSGRAATHAATCARKSALTVAARAARAAA